MEKVKFVIIFILWHCSNLGQEALHNFGNLKIHDTGAIGFHHNLINDGFTDDNKGLAGFYSNSSITISGALKPIFHDMEIMVADDLFLDVAVGVTNNSNFILGDVVTPRNFVGINLDYAQNAFYTGETDFTKVDGYSATANKTDFTFPIGYLDALRPLGIETLTPLPSAKSAYFFENPNTPLTFVESFNTQQHVNTLNIISTKEFWDIDASIPSKIRLTWNGDSEVANLVNVIENLRVVGWHTQNKQWEDLGNTLSIGSFSSGTITSETFIPDHYTVVTLGGNLIENGVNLANYLITPNVDGINDYLVIKEVEQSPKNLLTIYNRWGRAVYIKENYNNSFVGKANTSIFIGKNKTLPAGVYFYIIELYDIDVLHQGYLYIND